MTEVWRELERPGRATVVVGGVELRSGSRVRLRPRAGRDPWDALLGGRTAVVDRIEEGVDDAIHVVVTLAEDPARQKFFFIPDEIEPLETARILVAGVGNIFLGDDGFGCAVASALADAPPGEGVEVADFGVRGMDLAYALRDYDAAVIVDTAPLGEAPGTIAVIEPRLDEEGAEIETHSMDPVRVLRLARGLGGLPKTTIVVACQPQFVPDPESDEIVCELSAPLQAAVTRAVTVVRELVGQLLEESTKGGVR